MTKSDKTKISGRGKTPGSGRKPIIIDDKLIIEALKHSEGLIQQACDYLQIKHGLFISHTTLQNKINCNRDLTEILQGYRLKRVEQAMVAHQGKIKEGSSTHIFHMLDNWGYMIGYEKREGSDSNTQRDSVESAYNLMDS